MLLLARSVAAAVEAADTDAAACGVACSDGLLGVSLTDRLSSDMDVRLAAIIEALDETATGRRLILPLTSEQLSETFISHLE